MKSLDKKLFREINQMRFQAISIGLVIIAGITYMVGSLASYQSLLKARENFYANNRFAEGFVYLNRAPNFVLKEISELKGIDFAESRISREVVLDFPSEIFPSAAQLVSLTENLNQINIRTGRLPNTSDEVIISENFAKANHLTQGDFLIAIINGKRTKLMITGSALSPEFVYVFRPGSLMPDDKHYGILWMKRDAIETALNMKGNFNQVLFNFSLTKEGEKNSTLKEIDNVLRPFGGIGANVRNKLPSDSFLRDEFKQLKTTAIFLPVIFLGVAAFLLHIITSRLISKEREQIATLKALGYSNLTICLHYFKFISLITFTSSAFGVGLGFYLGVTFTNLYGMYYHFPNLTPSFPISLVLLGLLIGLLSGMFGSFSSLLSVVKLDPATAMRPPAPDSFRFFWFETLIPKLKTRTRMIIRNLLKRPIRTSFTILGLSMSVMIMVLGSSIQDTVRELLQTQFENIQRESFTLVFHGIVPENTIYNLSNADGVLEVEGMRVVPIRMKNRNIAKESVLYGMTPNSQLRRNLNKNLEPIALPLDGILLNETLAEKINIKAGEKLRIEILEGNRPELDIPVVALVSEYLGQGLYMDRSKLNELLYEGRVINQTFLRIDPSSEIQFTETMKQSPKVAGINSKSAMLKAFQDIMQRTMQSTSIFITIFTAIISVGVVFNTAMISLSEKTYELGSLRILGFTMREVFEILLFELSLLVIISLPIGCAFGLYLSNLMVNINDTEGFRMSAKITSSTYLTAITLTLITTLVSFLIIYRKLKTMDLLSVLKVRE